VQDGGPCRARQWRQVDSGGPSGTARDFGGHWGTAGDGRGRQGTALVMSYQAVFAYSGV